MAKYNESETPGAVKSGFVALVGRPNSGKSTLVNAIVGTKVAITSDKPQTTRHRLRAVYDRDDAQLVLVDTPGLHKPIDALGEELNRSALKSLEDVDVVAMLIDATASIGTGDKWVAQHVAAAKAKKILVLTKADIATAGQVDTQLRAGRALLDFDDEVVLSSVKDHNVKAFVNMAIGFLPMGPRWFPRDMPTDQSLEVMIAEFVREKILRSTFDEVPHAVGVAIEEMEYDEKTNFWSIWAVVYVERDSQKGIIIGKKGEMLKSIGSDARVDLERLLAGRVFLNLSVKVKSNWRRDASQIRRFGYGQGL
ncbi:MAG: GTPase Era [Coriobacteriia bacterium]|nr:GTPase Era [Coriobacteriia bacterium]